MVTTPEPSQQPVSPYDFFLLTWLANVTIWFFSQKSCQMPPYDFSCVLTIWFFADLPQRGNAVSHCFLWKFWCWTSSAVSPYDFFRQGRLAHVTIWFFSAEPAGPCHHMILFRPGPGRPGRHMFFICVIKIKNIWWEKINFIWRDALPAVLHLATSGCGQQQY